jgi:hypothetical protein
MADFYIIFNQELKSLVRSTKTTILSLVLVSLFWGFFLSYRIYDFQESILWIIFSAFVSSSGFANISFARERLVGSWEILLASGISRKTIFWAKLIFVQTASFVCGITMLLVAFSMRYVSYFLGWSHYKFYVTVLLFFFAAFSINILTAYFTILNINLRLINLINMAVMAVCITVITLISPYSVSVIPWLNSHEDRFQITAIIAMLIIIIPVIPILFLYNKALLDDKTISPIVY